MTVDIVGRVFKPAKKKKNKSSCSGSWRPTSHVVEYGVILDRQGDVFDEVLVVPMLAPRSYTREDVVELQCHGSEVCLRRVLRACLEAGATLAEPGEFTLRAFLNGRLDLSQAENVEKLISAKSVAVAYAALAGIQMGVCKLIGTMCLKNETHNMMQCLIKCWEELKQSLEGNLRWVRFPDSRIRMNAVIMLCDT